MRMFTTIGHQEGAGGRHGALLGKSSEEEYLGSLLSGMESRSGEAGDPFV